MLERLRRALRKVRGSHELDGMAPHDQAIVERCLPFTMTSPERVLAVVDAVRYLSRRQLPGAFVECGVWRGGSAMAMLLSLLEIGVRDRDVYLFDTFSGMTQPGARDVSSFDPPAAETWSEAQAQGKQPWHELFGAEHFSLTQVRKTLSATGYPAERLHFVEGPVEKTLPANAPDGVALLRLDTDWYESTAHELRHLYPRLVRGGVLIVDDYGHWQGCREAVDEYFRRSDVEPVLLSRIDYTGRLAIKP